MNELTALEKEQVVRSYDGGKARLVHVVRDLMKDSGRKHKEAYPLVSTFLRDAGLMKHGRGKRFCKSFGWRVKTCAACKAEFQPTGRSQRFCTTCKEVPSLVINYGITAGDYRAILEGQGGRCGICSLELDPTDRRQAFVDHDHVTAQVRGILCCRCNNLLTGVDDEAWLTRALAYLHQPRFSPRCECAMTRVRSGGSESADPLKVD